MEKDTKALSAFGLTNALLKMDFIYKIDMEKR